MDGPATVWINEVAPVWSIGPLPSMTLGVPIVPFDFVGTGYVSSPSGDPLVIALAGGALPSGLFITSTGLLYGTPLSSGVFSLSATDLTGTSTISPAINIAFTVPDFIAPNLADGFVKHRARARARVKTEHVTPANWDWQTLSTQEAEKQRRLDRKRRELWEGKREEPEDQLEHLAPLEELAAARSPFEPHALLKALHAPAQDRDDHEVHQMVNSQLSQFIAIASNVLRNME